MNRRRWLPRGAAAGCSALALFTVSSCYRAEIDLSDLMDDMAQGGTSSSSAGVGGSSSGTEGSDAPGGGGSAGAVNDSAAGQGGATEPPCSDEPLEPAQQVCFDLGRPSKEECADQDPEGWAGCRWGNCTPCVEAVAGFRHYFAWHPCCEANAYCSSQADNATACSKWCPMPSEHDKIPRCADRDIER